jgi:uncharacterized protein (TIGR03435 family)
VISPAGIMLPAVNRVELRSFVSRAVYFKKSLRTRAAATIAIALAILAAPGGWTQQPTARPQVEVAVIRLSAAGGDQGNVSINPVRFVVRNLSIQRLIYIAYKVKADQIIGGPKWVNSDPYDITATVEDMSGDNFPLMLQTLLEDRFKLKVHRDTKEGSVYDLTLAKGGVKMQPTKQGSCVPLDLSKKRPPPTPDERRCGSWTVNGPGLRSGTGIPMTDSAGVGFQSLTGQLSLVLDKPVIDKTGLSGLFDVELKWSPDETGSQAAPAGDSGQPAPAVDEGPSIFTAVREQLGMELKPAKGPVTVLVIDSVERPSEN